MHLLRINRGWKKSSSDSATHETDLDQLAGKGLFFILSHKPLLTDRDRPNVSQGIVEKVQRNISLLIGLDGNHRDPLPPDLPVRVSEVMNSCSTDPPSLTSHWSHVRTAGSRDGQGVRG